MAGKTNLDIKAKTKVLWTDRRHILWFPIGTSKYTVKDDQRIYLEDGLFNTVSNQTILYRVTDIQMKRSFVQKICGTGTIVLVSKIDQDHEIVLKNIAKPKEVLEMLSNLIEDLRRKNGMLGKEFNSRGGDHHSDEDAFEGDGPGAGR